MHAVDSVFIAVFIGLCIIDAWAAFFSNIEIMQRVVITAPLVAITIAYAQTIVVFIINCCVIIPVRER